MKRTRLIILLFAFGTLVVSGTVWAKQPHIAWTMRTLEPTSLFPGETGTYTVTFRNTGIEQIETEHLSVVATGAVAPLLTIDPLKLPKEIKRGQVGNMVIHVATASGTPVSLITGTLGLVSTDDDTGAPNVTTITPVLAVGITVSPFSLPPNPGPENDTTLLGVDSDDNGVRDDIDRYIGFTYPNSARKRAALTQYAQAEQLVLRDANDKAKTQEHLSKDELPALECAWKVFGLNEGIAARRLLHVEILNTIERLREYKKADLQLGGIGIGETQDNCSFQPNQLPN